MIMDQPGTEKDRTDYCEKTLSFRDASGDLPNCPEVTSSHGRIHYVIQTDPSSPALVNVGVQWNKDPPCGFSANNQPEDPLHGPSIKVEPAFDTTIEIGKHVSKDWSSKISSDVVMIKEELLEEEVVDEEHNMAADNAHFADDIASSSHSVVREESDVPTDAGVKGLQEVLTSDRGDISGELVKEEPVCDTTEVAGEHRFTNLSSTSSMNVVMFKVESSEEEVVYTEHNIVADISHFADGIPCSSHSVVEGESNVPSDAANKSPQDVVASGLGVSGNGADAIYDIDMNGDVCAYICSLCKSKFNSALELATHREPTHSMRTCSTCGAKFINCGAFRDHIEILHPKGDSLVCCTCNVEFSSHELLSAHHTAHKLYPCRTCSSVFRSMYNLKKHIRRSHSVGEFSCSFCDAKFGNQDNLTRHAKIHTGNKPYICDVCGCKFSLPHVLKRHIRTHTKEKPYTCDICGSKFSELGNLRTHQRIHSGEKPYTCDFCEMKFARKNLLQHHVRIHTGEKPYSCPECDAGFTQKAHLTSHLLKHAKVNTTTQSGEKNHVCPICNAKLTTLIGLKKHMKAHSEKPFACEFCDIRFGRANLLKSHMVTCTIDSTKPLIFS